ncbi:hypothetical protein LCGC14_2872080, partial [marine sediment metagenome]
MKKSLSKRTTGIIFLVIICASFAVYPSHVMAVEKTVIFPIPQQMELSDDPFTLDESVSIIVPAEASDRDLFLARFLVRELSDKYGIALKIESRDDIQLRVFDNFTEALFALLSAEVDAFAFPESVTWKLAREARVDKQIKVVGEPLKEIKRAMAVPKDKVELLAVLDRAVRDFLTSPEYQKAYVAWFGKPEPYWT